MSKFAIVARATLACAVLAVTLSSFAGTAAYANDNHDVLYVGDGVAFSALPKDNRVEVFDAITGTWLRSITPSGLLGPRGIVIRSGRLFLVNQNVRLEDVTGEILRFNASPPPQNLTHLVPAEPAGTPDNPTLAPFAPRGMILWGNHLFVANVLDPSQTGLPGGVIKYTAAGALVTTLHPPPGTTEFHPFGVVIGPDGLLYVSSRPNLFTSDAGGQVLRFDPTTGNFIDTFINNDAAPNGGCTDQLNSPEGIVFGPNGRLYVTSLRANADDTNETDKILIFAGPGSANPGKCIGKFDLEVGAKRVTAAALLFGPGGDLFVPITNAFSGDVADGDDRGAVRRYRVGCKQTKREDCFSNFVDPGGQLGAGWYLTFGKTRPGTLAYGG